MASPTVDAGTDSLRAEVLPARSHDTALGIMWPVIQAIASLKLTVALFAMAIFIVFTGTLAQQHQDIWEVVSLYFRVPFWPDLGVAWIELRVFSFFFPILQNSTFSFPFPGGWLIGLVMVFNLVAAHSIRFKIQARGLRLMGGLVVILAGSLMTLAVILTGQDAEGFQGKPLMEWTTLWTCAKTAVVAFCLASIAGLVALLLQHRQRVIEIVALSVVSIVLGLLSWKLISGGTETYLGDSAMRILWQLIQGGVASLVLLGGCYLVFKQRAGIVLLHAGVGLMMFSELIVGMYAKEAQMQISEGKTVNYIHDIRALELAVVDRSDDKHDRVVVAPITQDNQATAYLQQEFVRDDQLPFDVKIVSFYRNSDLQRPGEDDENPATHGDGLNLMVNKRRSGTGTDVGGEVDMASMYVELLEKDGEKSYGTYLLSQFFSMQDLPQEVTIDGKPYEIYLRFQRTYTPYSMHLVDVRFDKYMGTQKAKGYSSDLQLVDPTRKVKRDVKIWMNNPLRFAGQTFYQSNFYADPRTGKESTGLQVVTNVGWMIPYVGCMIVATGLIFQFGTSLLRFVRRETVAGQQTAETRQRMPEAEGLRPAQRPKRNVPQPESGPEGIGVLVKRWGIPSLIVLSLAGWVVGKMRTPSPSPDEYRLDVLGALPLVYEGRIKPFDTLARNSLRIMSGRQSYTDENGDRQPAIRWLMDVLTDSEDALKHKVFYIPNAEVQRTLGVERRKRFRYSIEEFRDNLEEFDEQSKLAHELSKEDPGQLSTYQKKILELDQKLRLFSRLREAHRFTDLRTDSLDHMREDVFAELRRREEFTKFSMPLVVPPVEEDGQWQAYTHAVFDYRLNSTISQPTNDSTMMMAAVFSSYADGDILEFNREVRKYRGALAGRKIAGLDVDKARFELFFNHASPFYLALVVYVSAFVVTCLSWLFRLQSLQWTAFALIILAFLVHNWALGSRILISGRPPVTNLYSSAVFIGWGCVVLGLILESLFRIGIGNVVAAVTGFATLLIAHNLAGDGDTFVVLQAVLDTQFWLATHVVCITLGYATTFVAGTLGVIYVLAKLLNPTAPPDMGRTIARMIYGIVCFSLLFSFVGTVLGGLWADDSWGRFWGWDPKENGALIIVLWNALILHSRWGGMVKQRGLALLAIGGNIVTSWSWFGVNELGVGLHSYGFTEGVLLALLLFVTTQVALIVLGVLALGQPPGTKSPRGQAA